jgi:hypothetical protein
MFPISDVLDFMLLYQKNNNIIGKCVSNSIFLSDYTNTIPVSGICCYSNDHNQFVSVVHCWCKDGNTIVEPSYDISHLPYEKTYYDTLNKYFEAIPEAKANKQYIVENFITVDKQMRAMCDNPTAITTYYQEMASGLKELVNY